MPPNTDDGAASFEALYQRLEQVAEQLSEGRPSLEESVILYEEGVRLANRCKQLLDAVEQRVETLRHAPADDSTSIEDESEQGAK
jgi:exodeoxyribonuclease VII small subunit